MISHNKILKSITLLYVHNYLLNDYKNYFNKIIINGSDLKLIISLR